MERRSFHRENSTHPTLPALNVFDDEFAVDDFDVADGFRPSSSPTPTTPTQHDFPPSRYSREEPRITSVSAYMSETPFSGMRIAGMDDGIATRDSTRKSRTRVENPFASVEDADDDAGHNTLDRTPSLHSQSTIYAPGIVAQRSVSSASSSGAYARSSSPFQGVSGPSHPYAMYPQGTNVGRTPSVSTTSTARAPQRTLSGHAAPTHPYAMYTQNVAEDIEDDGIGNTHAPIPVGFPGLDQPFHRRRGPDGEEQDIVGLDGHSEQLPPYSEYPEDGPPKDNLLPPPHVATPVVTPALQMPLMQRAPQSMSDTRNPAIADGFPNIQQMDSQESEMSSPKNWREMSWKQRRKIKFCGIPLWWTLLAAGVLTFIAIVLGAAIGGFLSSQRNSQKKLAAISSAAAEQVATPTTYLDASPIPSPVDLSAPLGNYALDIGPAQETEASCLSDMEQSAAWVCDIAGPPSLAIAVGCPVGGGAEGAFLYTTIENMNISYGTQPPETNFTRLIPVQDLDDPRRGPAFYFQTLYNKVVVLPENTFEPTHVRDKSKRSIESYYEGYTDSTKDWTRRKQVVPPGLQPWFCYWNATFIEGFIFANDSSNDNESSSSAATSTMAPPMTSSGILLTTRMTVTLAGSPATASSEPTSPTQAKTWNNNHIDSTYANHRVAAHTTSSGLVMARGADFNPYASPTSSVSWDSLSQYPYAVKIEERRVPNSPQPSCVKMQILDDGTAGVVGDPDTGLPITIALNETHPGLTAHTSGDVSEKRGVRGMRGKADGLGRRDVKGGCHCQWVAE